MFFIAFLLWSSQAVSRSLMFPPQLERVTDMDALQEWKALKRIYAIFPCKRNAADSEMRISQADHETIHPHLQTRLIIPAGLLSSWPQCRKNWKKSAQTDTPVPVSERCPPLPAFNWSMICKNGHTEKLLTLGTLFFQLCQKHLCHLVSFWKLFTLLEFK